MIYVITGLMASGKSTVAELLAKEFPKSVHLRGDVFRRMIVSGREEMSDTPSEEALSQLELRYRLTAQVAKEYHKAGFSVIVQDNYYGEMLPRFLEMLRSEPVQTIVLCPDAEIILQREAARPKTGYTGFRVEALHRDFMAATPRIGLWIDNSRQTPEETVAEILRSRINMITPYITFSGNCREALAFYSSVFGNAVSMLQSYDDYVPERIATPPVDLREWILHAEMEICGTKFWFADETIEPVTKGSMVKLTATVPTKADAQRIFGRLSEGATITLPPTETFYCNFHAGLVDQFGLCWNIVSEEAPEQAREG